MENQVPNQNPPQTKPVSQTPPTEHKPIYKNKIFLGFVIIATLSAFLIGGFMLGKN